MNLMNEELDRLRKELETVRSQFYIFYELTQAMRTTLRLDEIAYIILTGLTAHQGLGFNRAILFLINESTQEIEGFMGIGPFDAEEANKIWQLIEGQQMDLYALIENYRRIKEGKVMPRFMEFTRSLKFPLNEKSGIIFESLYEVVPLHIKDGGDGKYRDDPLVKKLKLKEFVIAPLWSKNNPIGSIVVDNYITKQPITDENIRILTMFVNQAAGAIENSKTYENTLLQAHTDSLTSMWNYGYFQYKLDEEIIKAKNQNRNVSIVMIDIDNFKKFNDAFGHQAGDEVLKQLGASLKNCARKIDITCRYGGDEFAIILPDTGKDEAIATAERIRQTVEKEEISGTHFTLSMGVATFPVDGDRKEEMIKKADVALYKAKSEGKNRVVAA